MRRMGWDGMGWKWTFQKRVAAAIGQAMPCGTESPVLRSSRDGRDGVS